MTVLLLIISHISQTQLRLEKEKIFPYPPGIVSKIGNPREQGKNVPSIPADILE